MALTPHTKLKLLKNPLELDNKNQLTFSNKDAQFNYFNGLPSTEIIIEDSYYQRKDNYIEYPDHIDNIIEYNYCMYQNNNYSDKWFYCFITRMEYVNDGCTRIYITTDVFQTWQFDFIFKESFVEREMVDVANDIPGNYLYPEGLETGEFKVSSSVNFNELLPVCIVAYTRNPYDDGLTENMPTAQGIIANGIPNGMFFCIVTINMLQGLLDTINEKGYGDAIMTIFTVPAFSLIGFNDWTLSDITDGEGVLWWFVSDFKANPIEKTLNSAPQNLDGYQPKNQKLRAYPYCYLGFNPPNGSNKIFRFENFEDGIPKFKMYSEINQNPSVCFIPENYRGGNIDSIQDCVTLSGYPTIGWVTDYFNTWIAQNSGIIELQKWQEEYNYSVDTSINQVQSFANALGSIFSKDLSGGMETAFAIKRTEQAHQNHGFYVQNQLLQKEKQAMLPNSGTLSSSNATLLGYGLMDNNIFTTYTIKKEFAERIDKFFDMYGYNINTVKMPNLKNRPNWNYIKTAGANILGNIPQEDLQTIKQIFDDGVTLWHNKDNFLDYSKNNR